MRRPTDTFGRQSEGGIPAVATDEVLEPHRDLIDRIRVCYGVDRTTFERELFTAIRRYAEFVHLLPATADNYFSAPGGLLRLGLEVGFFSLQGTDGHIFSGRSTITTRRHLEPRWRYATFVAGLCCELHRTLSYVTVSDNDGAEWQPYVLPLSTWLSRQRSSRYFAKWLPHAQETRALGVFALPHVLPAEVLQDLSNGNAIVVPHMMASISGMSTSREHNILDELVRRSLALVIDRDLQTSAGAAGQPQRGVHVERYLVDAVRRLIRDNAGWKPNTDKSRVWIASDGLFVVWPNAAIDIQKLLEADQLAGIPKNPDTILEVLLHAGLCEADHAGCKIWQIHPPGAKGSVCAIKLTCPELVFIDSAPQPLSTPLQMASSTATPLVAPSVRPATAEAAGDAEHRQELRLEIEPATDASPAAGEIGNPDLRLDAPMRLNPAVRETLASIIETLNRGGAAVAACTITSGVFIPLTEFERRNLEPCLVLRALREANMLVLPGSGQSPILTRDFGGEQKSGLVLHPRFIVGLDLQNFNVPD